MKTVIYNGKLIFYDKILENGYVVFENGKITKTGTKFDLDNFSGEKIDAKGCYVSPGFIDIHVHGGGGYRFLDSTKESVAKILKIHAKHGTTTMFPTVSALDYNKTLNVLDTIAKCKEEALINIEGVH